MNSTEYKKSPKTYIENTSGHFIANLLKHFYGQSIDAEILSSTSLCEMARKQLKENFGVVWHKYRLLDIGCGQLLSKALVLGVDNNIVGIDMELSFQFPYMFDFIKTLKNSGIQRAIKTLARQSLGKDYRFRRTLNRHLKVKKIPKIERYHMNAMQLEFSNNYFDGAYSFSVFQSIYQPDLAIKEVYRVLKPGAVAYIRLHPYTSITGSDHPLLITSPDNYPSWGHLRKSTPYYQKHGLYLNCWRLGEFKKAFESVFDQVRYVNIEITQDKAKKYLTDSIRAELIDYTDEELLTSAFIALCKKNK